MIDDTSVLSVAGTLRKTQPPQPVICGIGSAAVRRCLFRLISQKIIGCLYGQYIVSAFSHTKQPNPKKIPPAVILIAGTANLAVRPGFGHCYPIVHPVINRGRHFSVRLPHRLYPAAGKVFRISALFLNHRRRFHGLAADCKIGTRLPECPGTRLRTLQPDHPCVWIALVRWVGIRRFPFHNAAYPVERFYEIFPVSPKRTLCLGLFCLNGCLSQFVIKRLRGDYTFFRHYLILQCPAYIILIGNLHFRPSAKSQSRQAAGSRKG